MSQDERRSLVEALRPAQQVAFGPGEYVEQESFVRASELRALAARAGIGSGASVLDLCCGVAGPGRFLTRELGCAYLGVDESKDAVAVARERAGDLPCRFAVAPSRSKSIPAICPARYPPPAPTRSIRATMI